ncbi:MAG: alkaline phosphatase [Isosphaeraceae bacterium]|nr:alkaline phosphatase [Isosphaeraceae bacterium]
MRLDSILRRMLQTRLFLIAALAAASSHPIETWAADRLAEMQTQAIATANEKRARAYHFGSQGAGDVFTNHTSHTNRLVPVYAFGNKVDLGAVTRSNSVYRDEKRLRKLFGDRLPENTLNPTADYADQSDLHRVQKEAVAKGVKHLFIIWFDGMDWDTTRAAAIAKSGQMYRKGKGGGLGFLDYAQGNPQFASVVTTPIFDKNTPDVDAQTVVIPPDSLLGGYDAEIAGPNPWTVGSLFPKAPGYLKGQSADASDKAGVAAAGRLLHSYTDSSSSAGEVATGMKQYNNGVNVTPDGRFPQTIFQELQGQGWRVGTVTSVPFSHASPAAMYAHNVHRDDYQDLSRDLLGLRSIVQETGKVGAKPGLDVVIGTGFGKELDAGALTKARGKTTAGKNVEAGNAFITANDLRAIDVRNGGKYVVVTTEIGKKGTTELAAATKRAVEGGHRLFGFYGGEGVDHLPYRTADGDYRPTPGVRGGAEKYSKEFLESQPTLADVTTAALDVLAAGKKPFALFVEAGDVDFALHDNNLDNAIGALLSGDDAVKRVFEWVEKNSNWDDAAVIVTADHGHYLVIDDPNALIGTAK